MSNPIPTSGVAAVGASWSLGVRATRMAFAFATLGLSTYARWWWRLMRADNLHEPGMIRRRRAWLLVWTLSTLLLFVACLPIIGAHLIRAVGLVPLLAVLVAAVVSTICMWRQGRRARKVVAQPVAQVAASPVLDLGEWSDVNPRTQAAERAIGDLLWRLSEGMTPADAMAVVAGLPPFSQATVLWCAESNLARFSQLDHGQQLDTGPMLWFFDFTAKLRGWLGGGPTTAVAEPAMRRAS